MKKLILFISIFLCAFILQAQQYTLTDDDVVVTDGVIMSCSYDFTLTDIIIPETLDGQTVTEIWGDPGISGSAFVEKGITSIVFPETLLKIGRYTFYKNELSTVIIPNSVIEIGDNAFGENQLTSVTIPNGVTVLENSVFSSNSLTSINIPEGVTEIGDYAFSSNSLTSVSIPNSVTNIGEKAFAYNSGLASITLPTVATTGFISWIDEDGNTYENGVVVTNLTSFFIAQFAQTLTDEDVVVVDGIITSCTLNDTTTSITIPEVLDGQTIIGLGDRLFQSKGLTAVNLPATITSIGEYVFYNCNLTGIALPSNLTSIGKYSFYSNSLSEILFPESLTTIGEWAFFENNLTEVNIPGSVVEIEDYTFSQNYDLAKVTINEGVTSIGDNAFRYCYDLTDLSIPNTVIYIGAGAFDGYTSQLTSFTLPTPTKTGYTVNWIDSNSVEYATGAEVTDKAVSYTANFEINTYVISGTVTGANGVSLTLSGDVEETQTIITSGDTYSFNVEYDKSVELTATKLGYVFDTEQYSFPNIYGDKTETNFVASINEELNTYVPDDNFEQALIDLGYDTDLDDYVLTENINTITLLDVSSKSISDLTGIEDFVALEILFCPNNFLTSIDLSLNKGLSNLNCSSNELTSLNLGDNVALTELDCSSNNLISLNIRNGNNINFRYEDFFIMEPFKLAQSAKFTPVSDYHYDFYFNATNNPDLTCIQVDDADLCTTYWSLDNDKDATASYSEDCQYGNTFVPDDNFEQALINLGYDDVLDDYVLTENINTITYLYIVDKDISDLTGIEDFVSLEELHCRNNNLTSLDVSSNTSLTYLTCRDNNLTSLDVSNNLLLDKLTCSTNDLESLDVSLNTKLTWLYCHANNLTRLNVANGNNTSFTVFQADNNPNLTCIQVDDAAWSTTNWTSIDEQSYFNEESCYTYVPDDNFEQALIDLGYDTVLDNYVLTANISAITSLDVASKSIADLTGIEDFVALTYLNCNSNNLTALDVSINLNLKTLVCWSNDLISLDLSNNLLLEDLTCSTNESMTSLDISKNTKLTNVICHYNSLTILDLSDKPNLKTLWCYGNDLTSLDLNSNTALTSLLCGNNNLKSLDVNANTFLENLSCYNNDLTSLDVSLNTVLTHLDCSNNELIDLNVANGNNSNFSYDYGSDFNASGNPNLSCIQVDDAAWSTTNWTDIDATASFSEDCRYGETYIPDDNFEQALIDLGYDTVLDDYVLTENINTITYLDLDSRSIADLTGIEDFTALTFLSCYNNQLTSIIVSANTELYRLSCSSNQIEDIDVSKNLKLTYLGISNNNLTNLDIGVNILLENLYCSSNQLTSLDVSANTALTTLECYSNQLTSLNVSNNTALTTLQCSSNQLTSLDVSANIALTTLQCYSNQLTSLYVTNGNNTAITTFSATNNTNLTCIQVDDAAWSTTYWTSKDAIASFSEYCISYYTYVPDDNFEQALINLGYDSDLDDYVLTENINTITYLDLDSRSIADLTGIEDFTALTFLSCYNNQLTSIDVSANTELYRLSCSSNQIEDIDVSKNLKLTYLGISNNNLTNLDIGVNILLENLYCSSNQLTSLNVANGNNTAITTFYATNNPNLTCIQVDDAAWSTTNWTGKDATASFSEDCGSTLATESFELSNFSVYPNPSNGAVTIVLEEDATYRITSLTGQTVKTGTLKAGSNNLNLLFLNKTMYFLTITTQNAMYTEKLILK